MISVLSIDDEPGVFEMLRRLFKNVAPRYYSFSGAPSIEAAQAAGHSPDVLLLDLNLGPGKTAGADTVRLARKAFPYSPIVVLTGESVVNGELEELYELGVSSVVVKDNAFSPRGFEDELLWACQRALGRAASTTKASTMRAHLEKRAMPWWKSWLVPATASAVVAVSSFGVRDLGCVPPHLAASKKEVEEAIKEMRADQAAQNLWVTRALERIAQKLNVELPVTAEKEEVRDE